MWLHGWGISLFPITTVSTLLSVIIFTGRPFPHPTFTGARGAPKRHQGYNYSYHRAQNSYQLFRKPMIQHYSSIISICHPFQSSPIPLLRVVHFRSVLVLMLQNYKKNCLGVSLTGCFPFPTSMDMHIHIPYQPYGKEDSTWI